MLATETKTRMHWVLESQGKVFVCPEGSIKTLTVLELRCGAKVVVTGKQHNHRTHA